MSIEAGVVLGAKGEPLYWHLPGDRSGGALPDSRDLWDVFWEHRAVVTGFAHSHPGSGDPWYSQTDVTTFAAVEAALGRRLDWWIITSDTIGLFRFVGAGRAGRLDYAPFKWHLSLPRRFLEDLWVDKLREHSKYPGVEEEKLDEREVAIRADERRKVLDAVRSWAGELRYAPWPAWKGEGADGVRAAFDVVQTQLTEEALKKHL